MKQTRWHGKRYILASLLGCMLPLLAGATEPVVAHTARLDAVEMSIAPSEGLNLASDLAPATPMLSGKPGHAARDTARGLGCGVDATGSKMANELTTPFGLKPGGSIGLKVSAGHEQGLAGSFGLKPPVVGRKNTSTALSPLPPALSAAMRPVMEKADNDVMLGMAGMLGMSGMEGMTTARHTLLTPEASTDGKSHEASSPPAFVQALGATVFQLLSMPLMVAGLVVFGVCCFVLWRRALYPPLHPLHPGWRLPYPSSWLAHLTPRSKKTAPVTAATASTEAPLVKTELDQT
jgi:hypothetical protein